mmetsp:Transcript_16804/g.43154  ORF Transcript_16804/g.43154 Transcript_16804/m.43154 type:complete len:207 (+) Transcript_16804:80-700(+)
MSETAEIPATFERITLGIEVPPNDDDGDLETKEATTSASPRKGSILNSPIKPPSPTRSVTLQAQYARSREWPRVSPAWKNCCPNRPASARYKADDWNRLSQPRAGYSRDDLTGPAKKTAKAVCERNEFLRRHGYIDNPRELLHKRFHGTCAEQQRSQSSARALAQNAVATSELSKQQKQRILHNCWRTGRPVPDFLQRPQSGELSD